MKKKSWKTTISGVAILLVAGLTFAHVITPEQSSAVTTLLAGFGLVAAKDSNVTGGTITQ